MKQNQTAYTHEEVFGKAPSPILVALVTVGLLAIVIATIIPLLNNGFEHPWFRYLYAAGAVMVLAGRLFTPYTGKHPRMKRLARLESWSGIFFCVAAFFMFYEPQSNRDWLAFTLAGGAIQVIVTIISTRVASKTLTQK
ncbi:MAG: hypothetical protein K2M68_06715 [Muribaculaceae bacterium]|nr:hypothetical protein [Muribaculaceae bacterium]